MIIHKDQSGEFPMFYIETKLHHDKIYLTQTEVTNEVNNGATVVCLPNSAPIICNITDTIDTIRELVR